MNRIVFSAFPLIRSSSKAQIQTAPAAQIASLSPQADSVFSLSGRKAEIYPVKCFTLLNWGNNIRKILPVETKCKSRYRGPARPVKCLWVII